MDNPFTKIIDAGRAFFTKASEESVIGLDIGSSSIKVVQLKKKGGKAVLETYGSVALGPYDNLEPGAVTNLGADKIVEATNDLFKEAGITSKNAGLSISASSCLIFIIEFPVAVAEKDLATIVPMEARKYIPVPINEVSLDFFPIPRRSDTSLGEEAHADENEKELKREVLVVAIHNDTLEKYREIVKKLELNNSFFEVEIFSSLHSVLGRELNTIMVLDFGAAKTKISIVEYGVVKSFHVINKGSGDITNSISKSLSLNLNKSEELKREFGLLENPNNKETAEIAKISVDYIFAEANSAILNYEQKYNKVIDKVILTGGGSLLKGFREMATENFRSEVVLGNPFNKIDSPVFLEKVLESIGPEFTIAAGLALKKIQ